MLLSFCCQSNDRVSLLLFLRVSWRISSCSRWWQFCHCLQEEQIWASKLHLFIYSIQYYFAWQTFRASVVPRGSSLCVAGQGFSCACEYLPDVLHWTNLALNRGCGIIARRQDFPGRNGEACIILEKIGCYAIRFTWVCAVRTISYCMTSRVVMTARQEYTTSKFGRALENVSHFVWQMSAEMGKNFSLCLRLSGEFSKPPAWDSSCHSPALNPGSCISVLCWEFQRFV